MMYTVISENKFKNLDCVDLNYKYNYNAISTIIKYLKGGAPPPP